MIEIEPFECFEAKINYQTTDDLKNHAPMNGKTLLVQAMWIQGENDSYPNEFVFMPKDSHQWIPQRDLEIIKKVNIKEYYGK